MHAYMYLLGTARILASLPGMDTVISRVTYDIICSTVLRILYICTVFIFLASLSAKVIAEPL